MAMSPLSVVIRTAVMPGPLLVTCLTGTPSRLPSQATSSSADGLLLSASTRAPVTAAGYWSRAAASSARQGVSRVQLRSVSPGE